jgi:O-antigen ligase
MGVRRLAGIDFTYGHPNAVAASILFSLPFAYFLYTMRDDFSRTWPRRYQRWFPRCLWAFGLVGLLGVFLTRSRGGVVGLVALVVLMAMREGRLQAKVRRLVIVGCLLGAVFVCLPRDMQGRIQTIWDSSVEHDGEHKGAHTSALGRYYGFLRGMDMFRRYPVLGVGLGNYKQYRVDKLDGVYLSAHNLVGELLGETGILGGVSFLLVLVALGCNLRRIRRQLRDDDPAHPEVRALLGLRRACGDAVLLMLLQGLIGHNLQRYNWFWIAAFAWLAAHFAAQRRTRRVAEELQGVDAEYLETSPSLALTRV